MEISAGIPHSARGKEGMSTLRITRLVFVLGWNCLSLPSVLALDRPSDPSHASAANEPYIHLSVRAVVPVGEIEMRGRPAAAMISPAQQGALGHQAAPASLGPGVYINKDGQYAEVEPEALTWRLGSFSTNRETTKAHLTARAAGPRSGLEVAAPADFLIVMPKGGDRSRFQLLIADVEKDRRDFDVELAWDEEAFLGWTGKKNKTMALDVEELPDGTFKVRTPSLPKAEYGFLLPSFLSKADLPAEKIYTFRSPPDSQARRPTAAVATAGAFPEKPGVYVETPDGYREIEPEAFEWYPQSPWWRTSARYARDYLSFVKCERMNGALTVKEIELVLSQGAKFAIFCAEGTNAADYRLVSIESKPDGRKVRLDALLVNHDAYLGFGRLPLSPAREPITYQAERLGTRRYKIPLPSLKRGHYGFLGPGIAELGQTGNIHAFEIR